MKPVLYGVRSFDLKDARDFVTQDMAHHTARDLSRKRPGHQVAVVAAGCNLGWYLDGMRMDDIREGIERATPMPKPATPGDEFF